MHLKNIFLNNLKFTFQKCIEEGSVNEALYKVIGIPLDSTPITFWTRHKRAIHGTTSHNFRKFTDFSTPIQHALDPPQWAGWNR